jgi:hypothetical protein
MNEHHHHWQFSSWPADTQMLQLSFAKFKWKTYILHLTLQTMAMKRAASDNDADSTASAKYQATPLFLNRSVEAWQKLGLGCLSALPASALESTCCFLSTEEIVRLR